MKSYTCPFCKHKQTSVIQWQTTSVAHELNLEDKSWQHDVDTVVGDHECFICPECRKTLDNKLGYKFWEII